MRPAKHRVAESGSGLAAGSAEGVSAGLSGVEWFAEPVGLSLLVVNVAQALLKSGNFTEPVHPAGLNPRRFMLTSGVTDARVFRSPATPVLTAELLSKITGRAVGGTAS